MNTLKVTDARARELAALVAVLLDALRHYGKHLAGAGCGSYYVPGCGCGLRALLASAEGAKP